MWNEYAREKVLELDHERMASQARRPIIDAPSTEQHRLLAPVVRAAGRRVRRMGEALEDWASPARPVAAGTDGVDRQSFWV